MTHVEHATAVRQLWPLLVVQDINQSLEFYRHKLGFAVASQAEADGGVFWCRLQRGGTSIMLQQADEEDGPAGERGQGVALYFLCDDADALHAELSSRGVKVGPVCVADYGMKQLFVPEPDGYFICFESPTESWQS